MYIFRHCNCRFEAPNKSNKTLTAWEGGCFIAKKKKKCLQIAHELILRMHKKKKYYENSQKKN